MLSIKAFSKSISCHAEGSLSPAPPYDLPGKSGETAFGKMTYSE